MRFSTIAALCAAPLALATSLEAGLIMRGALDIRTSEKSNDSNKGGNNNNNNGNSGNVVVAASQSVSITEVIVIWINLGGTATTQTINTVSSTAAAAAAAATHTVSHPQS
jgi:hypothetical protein